MFPSACPWLVRPGAGRKVSDRPPSRGIEPLWGGKVVILSAGKTLPAVADGLLYPLGQILADCLGGLLEDVAGHNDLPVGVKSAGDPLVVPGDTI